GREGGGDAERGEGAAALEEGAAALGGLKLARHAFLPEFLVDVTDTIRGFRPQGPRPEARPRAAFRRAAASFRPTRSPRDSGRGPCGRCGGWRLHGIWTIVRMSAARRIWRIRSGPPVPNGQRRRA